MINRGLIEARKAKGWTQAYLASQLAVSPITVSRWENGIQIPQTYYVHQLCRLFDLTDKDFGFALCRDTTVQDIDCDIQALAPQYDSQGDMPKKLASRYSMADERIKGLSSCEESDGCFSFGRLKTTSIVLDGDGTEAYLSANIRTHYDPQPAVFFDEVIQAKKQIQQEQEEKQQHGEPHQWNGEK